MPKKDAKQDEWDARYIPQKNPRRGAGRSQGLLLILLAIGIPLIVSFIQVDGALRFFSRDKVFERTLSIEEKLEIRAAIARRKAGLDTIQRIIEEIKEKYRSNTGADYEQDVWVVHVREGLAIPFKYVLALGALLFLIGIGKLIL